MVIRQVPARTHDLDQERRGKELPSVYLEQT